MSNVIKIMFCVCVSFFIIKQMFSSRKPQKHHFFVAARDVIDNFHYFLPPSIFGRISVQIEVKGGGGGGGWRRRRLNENNQK